MSERSWVRRWPRIRAEHPKGVYAFVLAFVALAGFGGCSNQTAERRPNIIYIMFDDLGYGDLGCYGNTHHETPNIDNLAAKGMMLTDFHSNGAVCTPTRVSFITGRYPSRFGQRFESPLSYEPGIPTGTYSVADAMKQAGYATAVYGKWHIGAAPEYLPPNYGFDDFVGLATGDGDHHSHISRSGNKDWWKNDSIRMEVGYTTDLINKHSVDFIRKNRDKPFFLYVAHLAIHFPWQGPTDPPHRREGIDYGIDKFGIIPDSQNVVTHVREMIRKVDQGVGEIVATLDALNLSDNTLIVVTSDNGGYITYDTRFFNISNNGPFRGQKGQVYEGGHRVPCIFYWPGQIDPGRKSDAVVMTMDMMPTFAAIGGVAIPDSVRIDGMNILPHLRSGAPIPERIVGWKRPRVSAIRKGNWKYCDIQGKREMYNLEDDIGEQNNLVEIQPEQAKILEQAYEAWMDH